MASGGVFEEMSVKRPAPQPSRRKLPRTECHRKPLKVLVWWARFEVPSAAPNKDYRNLGTRPTAGALRSGRHCIICALARERQLYTGSQIAIPAALLMTRSDDTIGPRHDEIIVVGGRPMQTASVFAVAAMR